MKVWHLISDEAPGLCPAQDLKPVALEGREYRQHWVPASPGTRTDFSVKPGTCREEKEEKFAEWSTGRLALGAGR